MKIPRAWTRGVLGYPIAFVESYSIPKKKVAFPSEVLTGWLVRQGLTLEPGKSLEVQRDDMLTG